MLEHSPCMVFPPDLDIFHGPPIRFEQSTLIFMFMCVTILFLLPLLRTQA